MEETKQQAADEKTESPNYDVIDVAKQQTAKGQSAKSQGHTTRIFTTGDVDENFWLKYLGEEFRNAVHFEVDHDNNVRPSRTEHHNTNELNCEEKRTRFVRQPVEEKAIEHIPVESSSRHHNDNGYPTENPETINNDNSRETKLKHLHKNTKHNNLKQAKIKIHIKNKKPKKTPPNTFKATHTPPIVVNIPERQKTEYQINEVESPVVVQMPPVIYHRKADTLPEIHHGLITNLSLKQHIQPPQTHNTPVQHTYLHKFVSHGQILTQHPY